MVVVDTSDSFAWHRPLRRNPFICISMGIFRLLGNRFFLLMPADYFTSIWPKPGRTFPAKAAKAQRLFLFSSFSAHTAGL